MLVWIVGLEVGLIVRAVNVVSGLLNISQSSLPGDQGYIHDPKLEGSDSLRRRNIRTVKGSL